MACPQAQLQPHQHLQDFRQTVNHTVVEAVRNTITIDSYITSFVTLSLLMGVVFQLPVIAFFLGKMGIITAPMLTHYRRHAIMVIAVVAAIITPPNVMSLILVAIPLCLLYEVSIRIVACIGKKNAM